MSKTKKRKRTIKPASDSQSWIGKDGIRFAIGYTYCDTARFERMCENPFLASGNVGLSYGMITTPKGEGWNIGVL